MMKKYSLFTFLIFISCSLYQDNELPDIYFEYSDFDILPLGKTISDMMLGQNDDVLFLSDYNNNSVLKVDVSGDMAINGTLPVGSHPIAIDLNSNQSLLAVGLEGESKVVLINTTSFEIENNFPISLMNVNDLIFLNDSLLVISSKTDPSCILLNIHTGEYASQSVLNGSLAVDLARDILFVATSSSVKKYNWDGTRFFQDSNVPDPFGFTGTIHHFLYDSQSNSIFTCISSNDESISIQHVYSYHCDDMTFAGKYLIKSPGLAVAIDPIQERVFIAPTDSDKIGVFIVEFDQQTKLEQNYYLSAGNLTDRGLVVNSNGSELFLLVNIPGDDDSFEPYNNFSFDLQRIAL